MTFTFRRSKPLDKLDIGVRQSRLLNGVPVSAVNREAAEISYVFACLATVTVSPPNFDWTAVDDQEAMVALWNEYDRWDAAFRAPQPASTGEDS